MRTTRQRFVTALAMAVPAVLLLLFWISGCHRSRAWADIVRVRVAARGAPVPAVLAAIQHDAPSQVFADALAVSSGTKAPQAEFLSASQYRNTAIIEIRFSVESAVVGDSIASNVVGLLRRTLATNLPTTSLDIIESGPIGRLDDDRYRAGRFIRHFLPR